MSFPSEYQFHCEPAEARIRRREAEAAAKRKRAEVKRQEQWDRARAQLKSRPSRTSIGQPGSGSATNRVTSQSRSLGILDGHAAVFNEATRIFEYGEVFEEVVAPGAFTKVLRSKPDNTVANRAHDPDKILGRLYSGTLRLKEDTVGLAFSVDLPNTPLGQETAELVRRGDLDRCSFAFMIEKEKWEETKEGIRRTILSVSHLLDVALVAFPAYAGTSVSGPRSQIFPVAAARQRLNSRIAIARPGRVIESPLPRKAKLVRRTYGLTVVEI